MCDVGPLRPGVTLRCSMNIKIVTIEMQDERADGRVLNPEEDSEMASSPHIFLT